MAAVTVCSDFGAQNNKVWHCFHCFYTKREWGITGCCKLLGTRIFCSCSCPYRSGHSVLTNFQKYTCYSLFCNLKKYTWSGLRYTVAVAAKSLQSCLTLRDSIDGSPPGSPIPGILQARILEWVAISFSNAWKWKWKWSHSVVSSSPWPHRLQPTRLLCPWDFPGKRV